MRQIMAIGNVTPDSFFAGARLLSPSYSEVDEEAVVKWGRRAISEGASILDIGGCSTRPGSKPVEEQEEWRRVEGALTALRREIPDAQLSLDTFRPGIAARALEQFGQMIINDISGGCEAMTEVVKAFHAPYIWTLRGQLDAPEKQPHMRDLDLILDPGFGFIGSVDADYACLRKMNRLQAYGLPVLVGVSRKSMIYKPLGLTPETCLSATQIVQFYALQQGATILRTHDVAATAQTIKLFNETQCI